LFKSRGADKAMGVASTLTPAEMKVTSLAD
jgi:hypothetical protein